MMTSHYAGGVSMPEIRAALSPDDELHWVALRMTPGLGTRSAYLLIQRFRTPQEIMRAQREELEAAGLSPALARSIQSGCAFDEAVTQQQKMAEAGVQLIPLTDPRYPQRLKDIYDPPPVLFARGKVDLLGTLMLGVVGTRRPTAYGTQAATKLSKDLAASGLTIVSGMARGIDTTAHKAVLESGGNTVAVFGCGADQVYPAENKKLADRLAQEGLVVTEFPMGTPAFPQNFPVRNRIIAGMGAGVLVVEGGQYSGSAITAKLAMDQGREVFAVPGNIMSTMSWGPNLLIKQGAKLVQDWNDVVVELSPEDRRELSDRLRKQLNLLGQDADATNPRVQSSVDFGPMSGVARTVLGALKPDAPVALDTLVETLEGTTPSEIIAVLFELELAGLVRQLPGKSFLRFWAG
jgi:DNA processing protein